jgi:hypothetical protein
MLPTSSGRKNLVRVDAAVSGRSKFVDCEGRLQGLWQIRGRERADFCLRTKLNARIPRAIEISIFLNKINSPWRWRQHVPPKRRNTVQEPSVEQYLPWQHETLCKLPDRLPAFEKLAVLTSINVSLVILYSLPQLAKVSLKVFITF